MEENECTIEMVLSKLGLEMPPAPISGESGRLQDSLARFYHTLHRLITIQEEIGNKELPMLRNLHNRSITKTLKEFDSHEELENEAKLNVVFNHLRWDWYFEDVGKYAYQILSQNVEIVIKGMRGHLNCDKTVADAEYKLQQLLAQATKKYIEVKAEVLDILPLLA